jgi:oxygen-independent coproporphyrinogen-3 oxidase
MNQSNPRPVAGQTNVAAVAPPPAAGGGPIDALYLHLPFCFHKCHYCDFYSVVDRAEDRQEAFTDALIRELTRRAEGGELRPRTVFAGGGTPTYLRPALWARLLDTMHGLGVLDRCEEFTVEANPETVTAELMHQLSGGGGGVNRVSIGAQSFQRESLAALERWHDPDNVPRAVEACRAAGIDNLSLDLIFAIPGQTPAMLDDDLDRLVALRPTHLSTYGLTFEPNTPLTARLRVGQVCEIDEDTQRMMYGRVMDRLAQAGFEQYEVSNWAWRGSVVENRGSGKTTEAEPEPRTPNRDYRCAHNLAYWQNRNWLGIGPSAASHVDGRRWRNAPNLAQYLQASPDPPTLDHEQLTDDQRIGERFMLGLRLGEGVADAWADAVAPPGHRRRQEIDQLVGLNLLERAEGRLRLTREGRFVADSIMVRLL